MTHTVAPAVLEKALMDCFRLDVMALKPGNVHRHATGHDMSVEDFLHSAEVSAPILARADLAIGARILQAVQATRRAVGCNTNLGMLLLLAPLAGAAQMDSAAGLRDRLAAILEDMDRKDAAMVFEAIRLAAPGGLGQTRQYDVAGPAPDSLLAAMRAAQDHDRIAYQYANRYVDIFGEPLVELRRARSAGSDMEWALVACYLVFLTQFPDSHITRKSGEPVARRVMLQGEEISTRFRTYNNPEEAAPLLLEFDRQLKAEGINPGTSADLTAACYLVHELEQLMGNED